MPLIKINSGSTVVPNFFIDEYLPLANAEFVKVYIYALRCVGREISNSELAEKLGLLESDVVKAWDYWKKCGIITLDDDGICFSEKGISLPPSEPLKSETIRLSRGEIARRFRTDDNLSSLCDFAQTTLGKALSPSEMTTLYSIYTDIGLPADVIMQLVHYCKSAGKVSMKYIERVAAGWKQEGIDTLEAAEELCRREEELRREESGIKEILGIRHDRRLTETEKKYIDSWKNDLGYSKEIIRLAYDQTMLNTGKLSWPYLNTILRNWHTKGFKTASDIEKERTGRTSTNRFNNFAQQSSDTASVEQAAILKRMKEQGVMK